MEVITKEAITSAMRRKSPVFLRNGTGFLSLRNTCGILLCKKEKGLIIIEKNVLTPALMRLNIFFIVL